MSIAKATKTAVEKDFKPKVAAIKENSTTVGSDPELFVRKTPNYKTVTGAEKLLDEGAITAPNGYGKVIIDGVQLELNPKYSTCRESHAAFIAELIRLSAEQAKKKGMVLDFSVGQRITPTELRTLKPENQKFGCSESFNANESPIDLGMIDATKVYTRYAGGHIHIGGDWVPKIMKSHPDLVIRLCDAIAGNTMVLFDRDPANVERRKLYGRAGEYRLPTCGVEYRTLSNFWMSNYQMYSLAFALVRLAVNAASTEKAAADALNDIYTEVTPDEIVRAINENDYDLAFKNFQHIRKVIYKLVSGSEYYGSRFGLHESTAKEFDYFLDKYTTEGYAYWFGENKPEKYWTQKYRTCAHYGFNDFLRQVVSDDKKNKGNSKRRMHFTCASGQENKYPLYE